MGHQKTQPHWSDFVGACEDYRAVPLDLIGIAQGAAIPAEEMRRTMREKSRTTILRHPDPKR